MVKRPAVFMVGAFPPPVHGLSMANGAIAERLRGLARIVTFDTAGARAGSGWAARLCRLATGLAVLRFAIMAAVRRPSSIYIALSGGSGQLYDGMFAFVGNLLHVPVFIHHHSFRYISKPSRLTRRVFLLAGNATHIALCPDMAARLKQLYPTSVRETLVLSNTALFPAAPRGQIRVRGGHPLTLGFLSNITREKGVFVLFDVLSVLDRRGLHVRAAIAGPVADTIAAEFNAALVRHPQADYVGPVSGKEKTKFYESIDLLVFPSRYENEAEPLTVIEALGFGVPVIASDKGCIPSTLRRGGGACVADDERMAERIADFVVDVARSPDVYEQLSRGAVTSVTNEATSQAAALSTLLGMLTRTNAVDGYVIPDRRVGS
ncbi:glycosyltransferase family 4 protein [Paraburkholderia diazotrophica]|uniref:Glycosyltransferase involved in cell wall bisynthesis n=1 Tax=Paraburkholderia diazotrophica TaxID=667676 RepID=A0A1H7EGZ7_9BURK|nr:glycosyltransferase family 4 protein [Paraburkholderia diazotrophica]SEK13226.1 Glycosyltransferase involved in cell wall bisynthesis [Paraburkholderia diazotrophica]